MCFRVVFWNRISNLPPISDSCCHMTPNHQHRKSTWLIGKSWCPHPVLFCSMFVNLTRVHKPFHGTPQIKGQYVLLYVKWLDHNWLLDSSLTLKELIVLFHLFLVFGFCFCFLFFFVFLFFFCLYTLTKIDFGGPSSTPKTWAMVLINQLRVCI